MGYKVNFNAAAVEARLNGRLEQAQKFLDNEVLKDCDKYVPLRTGKLKESGTLHTIKGSGKVVYQTPYAHAVYYATHRNFAHSDPNRSAQWFEKAKAVKKHAWLEGVQKIAGGK